MVKLLIFFSLFFFVYSQKLLDQRNLTSQGYSTRPRLSPDGQYLLFSGKGDYYGTACDQSYRVDIRVDGQRVHRLSTGIGESVLNFYKSNQNVVMSSNFHKSKMDRSLDTAPSCPRSACATATTEPLKSLCANYTVMDLHPNFDLFEVNPYGNIVGEITNTDSYDGDASLSPDGQTIVFTSMRAGQPDLWLMDVDGRNVRQLTTGKGYKGGAVFSSDGQKIAFHAYFPDDGDQDYDTLLTNNVVPMNKLDIYTINVDGTNQTRVTNSAAASWTPYYFNDRIIFSANNDSTIFDGFNLFVINDDGTNMQAVTTGSQSNLFPTMDSTNSKLVWTVVDDANTARIVTATWSDALTRSNRIPTRSMNTQPAEYKEIWMDKKTVPFDGVVHYPGEVHLANVKQLTFGGQNAEGYFSFDNKRLTIQATGPNRYGTGCDQIYQIDLTTDPALQILPRMSTGLGGTTCSYFFNEEGNHHALYAGNFWNISVNPHDPSHTCPPKKCEQRPITDPELQKLCDTSYTWDIVPDYDIFKVNEFGNVVQQLTNSTGYDAEGVLSPDGKLIAFTSIRSGDLELWIMNSDGSNPRMITDELGYDGGSFFSPDGKRLIFRASRPKTDEEIKKYKDLLKYNLVAPTEMELFVVDIDGKNLRQITHLGAANWAPYYLNDNKRVIFSTDFNATAGFGAFDLYVINDDGTGLTRITWDEGEFDAFPMMSYDGKKLVWGSSRNGSMYELNLFIADWVDPQDPSAVPPTPPAPTPSPIAPQSNSTLTPPSAEPTQASASWSGLLLPIVGLALFR